MKISGMRVCMLLEVALLSGTTFLCEARDYEIKLHRPSKVGDIYKISVIVQRTQKTKITVDGSLLQDTDENEKVLFEGKMQVDELSNKGNPSAVTITVSRFASWDGNKGKVILVPGVKVKVRNADQENHYEIDGKPVSQDVKDALDMVVILASDDLNDDEIFGTSERKKVGDKWNLNIDLVAKKIMDLEEASYNKEDIRGTCKLDKVLYVKGIKCFKISGSIETDNIPPSMFPKIPIDKGRLEIIFSGKYPIDTSVIQLEDAVEVSYKYIATAAQKRLIQEMEGMRATITKLQPLN